MRKLKKTLAVTLVATMLCSVLTVSQANAAVKHKGVYSTLKNGVLTISGKGKMPKSMKFRGNATKKR